MSSAMICFTNSPAAPRRVRTEEQMKAQRELAWHRSLMVMGTRDRRRAGAGAGAHAARVALRLAWWPGGSVGAADEGGQAWPLATIGIGRECVVLRRVSERFRSRSAPGGSSV
eukprot:scaffold8733_cov114-Isochrysis_galbana.AAC.3